MHNEQGRAPVFSCRSMTRSLATSFGAIVLLASGCVSSPPVVDATRVFHRALALRWAPIHYQDVEESGADGLRGRADLLTAVDFDGDWDTQNNWENLEDPSNRVIGTCYYSVVTACSHWFVLYAFYHPRDWEQASIDTRHEMHENDMEGILLAIRRPLEPGDDAKFGTLEAMITVYRDDFFAYVPSGSPFEDADRIDGEIGFESLRGEMHPVTAQEAQGHGVKARPKVDVYGRDWVRYRPTGGRATETVSTREGSADYELVDIFESGGLWAHRDDTQTFEAFGVFRSNNGGERRAFAPWRWRGLCCGGQSPGGEIAVDPVRLLKDQFRTDAFTSRYEENPYLDAPQSTDSRASRDR